MTKSRWIIFALFCLGLLGFLIFTNKQDPEVTYDGDVGKIIDQGPIKDHVFGNPDRKVVLIEYGDFQCPACGKTFPAVEQLKATYKDKLTFVFRNLPLTSIHPNALAAATAAEAAGKQGKFFEMYEQLYSNQDTWKADNTDERSKAFETYAKSTGLNIDQYKKDLASKDVRDKISRDRSTAKSINANSTPTFMLNGQKMPSETTGDLSKFYQAVEQALVDAKLVDIKDTTLNSSQGKE